MGLQLLQNLAMPLLMLTLVFILQGILKGLNNRSLEELTSTKGIGKSKATLIVQYRDSFGPLQSVEDLFQIKGFGAAFFEKLQEAGELAAVKKKTSKGLETIWELLLRNKKKVCNILTCLLRGGVLGYFSYREVQIFRLQKVSLG